MELSIRERLKDLRMECGLPLPARTLPGSNGIRITHYTLQAKLCAKWDAVPFGYPHNKQLVSWSACSSL